MFSVLVVACSPLTTSMITPPCWNTAKARRTAVSTSAPDSGSACHGATVVGSGGGTAVVDAIPATWLGAGVGVGLG